MRETTVNLKDLLQIFNCKSKGELKKHARNTVVYQQDMVAFVLAAQQGALYPYLYANHFARKVPDHLMPNEKEQEAISKNGIGNFKTLAAQKFARKVFQMPVEQRSRAAHLFYTSDHKYWNLFYFDNRDRSKYTNHWKHGGHIHFVSDLWSRLSMEEAWKKVKSGELSFQNKLHLRYVSD